MSVPDPRRLAMTATRTMLATAALVPGVVGSLVHHRERVVEALRQAPLDPAAAVPTLVATGLDGLGERLVRAVLDLADDPAVRADLIALAEFGAGPAGQVQPLAEAVQSALVDPLAAAMGVPDLRLRAGLIATTLGGVVAARSVLGVEPLASASPDTIVAMVAPTVQRLLDPTEGVAR